METESEIMVVTALLKEEVKTKVIRTGVNKKILTSNNKEAKVR